MIVYSTYAGQDYERMVTVMRRSVHVHNPNATIILDRLRQPEDRGPDEDTGYFLAEVSQWAEMVATAWDELVLLDADMLCRGELSGGFGEHDITVTVRDCEQKYNAGVMFVKPTGAAATFFMQWLTYCRALTQADDCGESLRKRWGSIDQAALACLIQSGQAPSGVSEVDCVEWNACQQNWTDVDKDTRLVHIKGLLRKSCLAGDTSAMGLGGLVEEWKSYE